MQKNSRCALIVSVVLSSILTLLPGCGVQSGGKSECGALMDRFDAVLAGTASACRTDADCGCYNPVSKNSGCGGITNRAASVKLAKIENQFHRAGCDWPVDCGAWICQPVCVKGRCGNRN